MEKKHTIIEQQNMHYTNRMNYHALLISNRHLAVNCASNELPMDVPIATLNIYPSFLILNFLYFARALASLIL